ncbi:MAM and LDL-receptor class A domain-containing protein 1-like [Ruditapes philippinarum]|uniref:MAM and LDL-receptor class A domain-containing protein 1-like n=1 Tax=Ruditapes philippinarum TaxID=129788 RepID=UPI00295B4D34|nr:MAM and LDL-receptor class A domain-containing protein 1-like [Ruditapes philippinarum]
MKLLIVVWCLLCKAQEKAHGSVIPTGSVASIGQASQLSCYFEDSDCGYTNSQANDFNWTRNSGPTKSDGTGPPADHTYGTESGHYFYIETSQPRTLGEKAQLLSRAVSLTSAVCVSFYYHMYGYHIGALNVYVNSSGVPVWSRKGKQQDRWTVGQLTMHPGQNQQVRQGCLLSPLIFSVVIDWIMRTSMTPPRGIQWSLTAKLEDLY